jgi:hypothetical protein
METPSALAAFMLDHQLELVGRCRRSSSDQCRRRRAPLKKGGRSGRLFPLLCVERDYWHALEGDNQSVYLFNRNWEYAEAS